MKNKIIIFLIFIELIFIIFLGIRLYKKYVNSSDFQTVNISPIKKDSMVFGSGNLKSYYEPKANETETFFSSWLNKEFSYRTNSDGLIEKQDYLPGKNPDTFRIIALGDSFTYGIYVSNEDNWTKQLEKLLNTSKLNCGSITKFEVLNLAVPGYDLEYSIERFLKKGKKYHPDLIAWFVKDDDVLEINEKIRPLAYKYEEKESSDWFDAEMKARNTVNNTFSMNEILNYQKNALQKMNGFSPAKLLLFTLTNTSNEVKLILKEFAKDRTDVFFYDGIPDIYSLNGSFEPYNEHPNELGHSLIAKNLYQYLIEKNLIPCSKP